MQHAEEITVTVSRIPDDAEIDNRLSFQHGYNGYM